MYIENDCYVESCLKHDRSSYSIFTLTMFFTKRCPGLSVKNEEMKKTYVIEKQMRNLSFGKKDFEATDQLK